MNRSRSRGARLAAAASAWAILFALPRLSAEPPARFVLRAARIFTGEEEIPGGMILIENGKIAAVGRDLKVPEGVRVVDLPGRAILPGLIDSETTLAEGGRDTKRSITPDVLAADGWDFYGDRRELLQGGVTAVYVSTGTARLLSGRGLVVKTGGHDGEVTKRILRRIAGARVTLGERSKFPPALYQPPVPPSTDRPFEPVDAQLPSSRAGEFMALREVLGRARAFGEVLAAPAGSASRLPLSSLAPERDPDAAALLDVVSGMGRLHVQVDRAHDIERTLALAREMGVGVVLEGAREAYRIPELIAKSGAPVIYRGEARPGRPRDEDVTRPSAAGLYREDTPAVLARAGVPVAIDSPSDSEVEDLLLQAAVAVREGLPPAVALRAITLTAADILGVADRVGSLAPGKDADLVVLPGDQPFGPTGGASLKPEAVFIDGELVYLAGPREIPPDSTVIRCGRILTPDREIPSGTIIVRDGKIIFAGPGSVVPPDLAGPGAQVAALPPSARVIDASADTVVPGMIDSGSRLGVHVDMLLPHLGDDSAGQGGAPAGGGRSTYRLADAVDTTDPAIALVLRRGITTAIIAPEPVGTVAGQLTAMKLSGAPRAQAILRDHAGILFGSLRAEDIDRARAYHDKLLAYEQSAGKDPRPAAPAPDESLEALRPLFQGKAPAVVRARYRGEVSSILEQLADKHRISVGVLGLNDPDEETFEQLKRRGAVLLLGPPLIIPRSPPDADVNLPRLAASAGVAVALRSGAAAGARHLTVEAAFAVREGWDAREALRSMTSHPARLFKIDDRVGMIEKGKDADLVFLTGDPFAAATRVKRVMIDGRVVHQEAAP